MKLGLFGINMGALAHHPDRAIEVARAAEAAGWESVWTGEHFALPDPVSGWSMSPAKAAAAIGQLNEAHSRYERPPGLGDLEISITPPHRLPVDTDVVEAYADIGVTRLILLTPGESHEQQDELLEFVASMPQQLPT